MSVNLMNRWLTYQRERFPLARHAPLVAVTSVSVLAFAASARGGSVTWTAALAASLGALLLFLQLRLLDEFKDAEDDAAFRPYRPVPRGLVTLRELGAVGVGAAAVQFALGLVLSPRTLPWLLLAWGYMLLMFREFFVRDWLKARPTAYMLSHLVIVALIQLYVAAWDFAPRGGPPPALAWLVLVSLAGGALIEVGRKLRAPDQEERGVPTYTRDWGLAPATGVWLACALLGGLGVAGAWGWAPLGTVVALAAWAGLLVVARRFLTRPTAGTARPFEPLSGLWVLGLYVALAFAGRA